MRAVPNAHAEDWEDVSEQLEFVPTYLQVIEEVRPQVRLLAKGCGVAAAQKPGLPFERGSSRARPAGVRGGQQIRRSSFR